MSSESYPSVVPPPTMLPPPPPSQTEISGSSSSSSRKRKRDEGRTCSSYAPSSASSEFSSSVKRKLGRVIDDASCWHCGARPTDICHVIGKKDREFQELVERGFITFDHLGHLDNALPLCPTCHRNFDDLNKPGLIFLPSDLQYFIDFEVRDYSRREESAKTTRTIPRRTCPTPQMYYEHQLRTGLTEEEDHTWGGLYQRYTLYDYFPKLGQDNSWIPGRGPFQEPEPWHGAPMAAIWRAFLILGNPLCGIPDEETRFLRELQDLYKRKIDLSTVPGTSSSDSGEDDDEDRNSLHRGGSTTQRPHALAHFDVVTATRSIQRESAERHTNSEQYGSGLYDNNGFRKADSGIDIRSYASEKSLVDCTMASVNVVCESIPDAITTNVEQLSCNLLNWHKAEQELENNGPSSKLPRKRPRSMPRYHQSWAWGPASSSRDKITHRARKRGKMKE